MTTHDLLKQALALSPADRLDLAHALYDSVSDEALAGSGEREMSPEWRAEVERRLREVEEGRVRTVPLEEALAAARSAVEEVRKRRPS